MSNQEPPFEEQPYPEMSPRPEQLQPPFEERPSYPQQPPFEGQQPYPGPQPQTPYYGQPVYQTRAISPRRRRGLLCGCLAALVIALLLCSGGTFLAISLGFAGLTGSSVTDPVETYQVAANPTLVVNDQAGSVTIKSGSVGYINIQPTRFAHFGANIKNIHTQIIMNGATNTLNVTVTHSGQDFFNTSGVNFAITVPDTTNLQVSTNAGNLNISGVRGTMSLNTNAGSIGVNGSTLTGSSTFKTNAGSVNFTGSIGTSGTYDFETNAGSIDIVLPATSAFHVNASTDAGSITTSFPVTVNHSTVGATLNGDIGNAPQATVTLKTNAGSITLNKGS